jgi:DNA-directed RNA polymerase subunit L
MRRKVASIYGIADNQDYGDTNAIHSEAMAHPKTLFAGYRVPHPLVHNVEIKLQTEEGTTPFQVLQESIANLIKTVNEAKSQFDHQIENITGDVDMSNEFTPHQSSTPWG